MFQPTLDELDATQTEKLQKLYSLFSKIEPKNKPLTTKVGWNQIQGDITQWLNLSKQSQWQGSCQHANQFYKLFARSTLYLNHVCSQWSR